MDNKVSKATIGFVKFIGSLMITLFSGMFGFTALAALFCSITEGDIFGVIACIACSALACICWSVRKDVL